MPVQYEPDEAVALFPADRWEPASGGGGSGDCVTVNMAREDDDMIGLRDDKLPNGPTFVFTRSEWGAFLGAVESGKYKLKA
jgi:hypothetical protein